MEEQLELTLTNTKEEVDFWMEQRRRKEQKSPTREEEKKATTHNSHRENH